MIEAIDEPIGVIPDVSDATLDAPIEPGAAAIREPVVHPLGRPTRELALSQLVTLSIYWLGINVMWTGLHVIVLPKRMEAIFGPASAGLGLGLITLAGVVTAINWISPPPYPQKVFSSMPDAEKWITAQLAARRQVTAGA